jgi:hypothetical protein
MRKIEFPHWSLDIAMAGGYSDLVGFVFGSIVVITASATMIGTEAIRQGSKHKSAIPVVIGTLILAGTYSWVKEIFD